jgi:DNA-binding GntR family transcriptional regulator
VALGVDLDDILEALAAGRLDDARALAKRHVADPEPEADRHRHA